jgi:hypothetical protein
MICTAQVANRYNAVQVRSDATFDIIYGHNFYTFGTQRGVGTVGCTIRQLSNGDWTVR